MSSSMAPCAAAAEEARLGLVRFELLPMVDEVIDVGVRAREEDRGTRVVVVVEFPLSSMPIELGGG